MNSACASLSAAAVGVTVMVLFAITFPGVSGARGLLQASDYNDLDNAAGDMAAPPAPPPVDMKTSVFDLLDPAQATQAETLIQAPQKLAAGNLAGSFAEQDAYLASLVTPTANQTSADGTGRRLAQNPQDRVWLDIRPAHASFRKCVDVPWSQTSSDNVQLHLWDCNNSPAQAFMLQSTNSAFSGHPVYNIKTSGGKCLDNPGWRGAALHLLGCNGGRYQQWYFERAPGWGEGVYRIRHFMGGLNGCLGVAWGSQNNGAAILKWDCGTGNDQFFWVRRIA